MNAVADQEQPLSFAPDEYPTDAISDDLVRGSLWFAAHSHLGAITLSSAAFRLYPVVNEGEVSIALEFNVENDFDDHGALFQVSCKVLAGDPENPLFTVDSTHLAFYAHSIQGLPEAVMKHVGETSVMLSVYPYIRELVQSLTSRAGLPALTLDLLRMDPSGSSVPAL